MNLQENYVASQNEILTYLTDKLAKNINPWLKPWDNVLPYNSITNKPYQGNNTFSLEKTMLDRDFSDPRFMTFIQAKEAGYQIKKGAKACKIYYFSNDITKKEEEDIKIIPRKYVIKCYNIFNAKDIVGIPPLIIHDKKINWEQYKDIDNHIDEMKININTSANICAYVSAKNTIQMVDKNKFQSPEEYYSVLFHEISHYTGHHTRFDRLKPKSDKVSYVKEEITAEISTMMLCNHFKIGNQSRDNSISYIQNWYKHVKNDKNILKEAIRNSYYSSTFILSKDKDEKINLIKEYKKGDNKTICL